MGLNKFITKKGRVLLDLTEDTVTPETLGKGVTAHDRSGEPIVGTMEGGSSLPIDVATEEEMNALLETAEVGAIYKYTGETTDTYENGALYVVVVDTSGSRVFGRLITKMPTTNLPSGLYDVKDNLVVSWDTLVNTYGMDISKDYGSNYKTDTASPYYILANNDEFYGGVKLVVKNVNRIGNNALRDDKVLTTVIIGDGVEAVGSTAFNASSLNSVILGDTVKTIGGSAFRGIASLTSVTFGNSVTTISGWAFADAKIESIIIPNSVTSIGEGAFYGCKSLSSITFDGTVAEWNAIQKATGTYKWNYNVPATTVKCSNGTVTL